MEQFRLPQVSEELGRVEEALQRAVGSDDPFLSEIAGHLVAAGGKRLRPALVIGAAVAGGADVSDDVIQGAVSVELVHLGSLYHDDVMDDATERRGVPSVNARWGNLIAILAGDFLLARASEIAASLGTEVAGLLARTIGQLCQGEVSQLHYSFNTERSEASYLKAIAGKTASLMATSARIGGLVGSGISRSSVEALTAFGRSFGMTFQIWDDIRDLVSTAEELGKPAGHDLVEGTYTLPVIRALATPGAGQELRALLGGPIDGPTRDKARDVILGTGALESSLVEARRWADQAAVDLRALRCGRGGDAAVDALSGLGHGLLDSLDLS